MATCPSCGVSSRKNPTAITLEYLFSAEQGRPWSLSDQQIKALVRGDWRMWCRCGWSIIGRVEGEDFYGFPDTQVFPPPPADQADQADQAD